MWWWYHGVHLLWLLGCNLVCLLLLVIIILIIIIIIIIICYFPFPGKTSNRIFLMWFSSEMAHQQIFLAELCIFGPPLVIRVAINALPSQQSSLHGQLVWIFDMGDKTLNPRLN